MQTQVQNAYYSPDHKECSVPYIDSETGSEKNNYFNLNRNNLKSDVRLFTFDKWTVLVMKHTEVNALTCKAFYVVMRSNGDRETIFDVNKGTLLVLFLLTKVAKGTLHWFNVQFWCKGNAIKVNQVQLLRAALSHSGTKCSLCSLSSM